jgi:hypothetical protein
MRKLLARKVPFELELTNKIPKMYTKNMESGHQNKMLNMQLLFTKISLSYKENHISYYGINI